MPWIMGSLETTTGDIQYTMDLDERRGIVKCEFPGWSVELTAAACRALAEELVDIAEQSELPEQGSFEHESGAKCRGHKV